MSDKERIKELEKALGSIRTITLVGPIETWNTRWGGVKAVSDIADNALKGIPYEIDMKDFKTPQIQVRQLTEVR